MLSTLSDAAHSCMSRILTQGPVPRHIAFIMDGNRRWARQNKCATAEGHSSGFESLRRMLQWCVDLGVEEVTVYAFSIENFKRTPAEVDALMRLAKDKFQRIIKEGELVEKYGVSVRVLGDMSLLPVDVQQAMQTAVDTSSHNTRSILNVCFAYTSSAEVTRAVDTVARSEHSTVATSRDISAQLYTGSEPDVLIRTSGEYRLSDFLLWQSAHSVLAFVDVLWPDISFFHLAHVILRYQLDHAGKERIRRRSDALMAKLESDAIAAASTT